MATWHNTTHLGEKASDEAVAGHLNSDILSLVPIWSRYVGVEERYHRGNYFWAVVVGDGEGRILVLNTYTTPELADQVALALVEQTHLEPATLQS